MKRIKTLIQRNPASHDPFATPKQEKRKKPHALLLLPLFPLFLLSPGCRQENPLPLSLPPITETGQNTLGFLLNNSVWVNGGRRCTTSGCSDNKVRAVLFRQPGGDFEFELTADYTRAGDTIDQSFTIAALNLMAPGTYAFDAAAAGRVMEFQSNRNSQHNRYYINRVAGRSTVRFTRFDTTAKIVSGTFDAVLFNPFNPADSVVLRNGRFDAQLDYRR
jgi:hypothetical protein